MTFAILAAAGSGKRFTDRANKKSLPKQFLKIHMKPVILYSLLALQECKEVDEIIITLNDEFIELIDKKISANKITKVSMYINGGKTRFESVKNVFSQIAAKDNDMILIHDAARPNITSDFVSSLIKAGKNADGIITGNRITDTVKRESKTFVKETLDRNELWTVQTPQVFRYKVLSDSYKKADKKKIFTDESSMAEAAGFKIKLFEGPKENIKITVPEDIELLKYLLKKTK
jgi:2-C-methyl-D-erythritol 4-phosphate cytidylyltransferase